MISGLHVKDTYRMTDARARNVQPKDDGRNALHGLRCKASIVGKRVRQDHGMGLSVRQVPGAAEHMTKLV